MKTPVIEAKKVVKEYHLGETIVSALAGVSLKIYEGDFVVIVGPSGSGKSTLMHLLGTLDHPTRGTVLIDGEDISELDDWDLAMLRRKKIGFIFQSFNLIPTLNSFENVIIPTEPLPGDKEKLEDRGIALLKKVGLGDRLLHKPDELSGGQRQRVSISRSLINNPEIIFADEPTGNLDSVTGRQIIDLMYELNTKENKTFVLVTHDETLLKYATKKVFILDGKITKVVENPRSKKVSK
ncbi:MAG: lipoprotein-releasing system ATP-binding protein LolD [Candidatus Diapherotrites archaeon]|uniref:Lipoprotein-releasing system ATP-binding protein LolD n=1 Tax=Candidatus Iainarchaeum sp. TaxID=3101447 RepID=A0A2D6LQ90_9ARCH|nr:lipoprotein-releasing system ATP-binding protein LolD [Candidatus Diapherotrites archaeon]|tara:strand:+ start:32485 stop:33198 length:714 start_codon:yes stop_codon:yes gene_type:complete